MILDLYSTILCVSIKEAQKEADLQPFISRLMFRISTFRIAHSTRISL